MSRARDLGSSINSTVAGKNLVYNGNMNLAQRGTTFTSVASDIYTLDRWLFQPSATGTWTVSRENDAPSGSGIANSLKILCTTAQASLASGAFMQINQHFEGQDLQKLKKGSSLAETTVLSFWVKSNVTGNYVARIYDATNVRAIHQRYTINSANTWEKKTWLIPGDTIGALNNDTLSSLRITFWLAAGATYNNSNPNATWSGYDSSISGGGQVNLASAVNNYFQLTGVQWEIGSSPTQFSLGGGDIAGELLRCQRYYFKLDTTGGSDGYTRFGGLGYAEASSVAMFFLNFPTTMRARPALSLNPSSTYTLYNNRGFTNWSGTFGLYSGNRNYQQFGVGASGLTTGEAITFLANNNFTAYLEGSAEL